MTAVQDSSLVRLGRSDAVAGLGQPPVRSIPLKVAIDAGPLLAVRTGIGVFCQEAINALSLRPELTLSAFAVTWRRRQRLLSVVPPDAHIVQRPMPARPLRWLWARGDLPPIEWFVGRADVVHGTNFVVPPTHRSARVVSVFDLTPLHYPELCDEATRAIPRLLRRAIRSGAWVHTPSRFVAGEVIEAFAIDPDRVRTVPLGIPGAGEEHPPRDESGPPPFTLPVGTSRYILAVGTIEPRKDYPGLVRAFDRIGAEDVALVIAGADGWGVEPLEEAIRASRRRHRILRLGYIDDDTRRRATNRASLLAYPSLYEGFGFPPLEAMRSAVPVVATAVGSVPEVSGDGALLVEPGNPDALAGALDSVLDDGTVRAALIERGLRRAEAFSWDLCAEGLSRLYADAAS